MLIYQGIPRKKKYFQESSEYDMDNIRWEGSESFDKEKMARVNAAFKDYGINIPAKLASFLKSHSNAVPYPNFFDTNTYKELVLQHLVSVDMDRYENLYRVYQDDISDGFRRNGFYPIAIVTSVNDLAYLASDPKGVIYLYYPDMGDIEKVASSFDELLTKLYSNPDVVGYQR